MEVCNACHIHVEGAEGFCPLCGTALEAAQPPAYTVPQNHYPNLSKISAGYNLVLRLFVFLSLLGCGLSVLVNVMIPTGFWWCLIVIAAVLYLWLTIPPLLRQGTNYAKRIVLQAIFTSALVVALDAITGYRGWSVTYVLPGLLSAGILAIGLMVMFNRTSWTQYVFYQFLMGLFGFIPLLLYFLGVAQNLVMVLLTAAFGLASLLVTLVFGDRSFKSDFKRRFHF